MRPALTEVRASSIAGQGLFRDAALAKGELALRYDADPVSVGDFGRLNHSCDPNLGWADGRTLVALRDIAAGEELTLDYATCLADPGLVMYCHCGTYRCRQVIEGADWTIPQLRQRYAGHWAPVLQRRIDDAAR